MQFNQTYMRVLIFFLFTIINVTSTLAQDQVKDEKAAYEKVITERATKLVAALQLNDEKKSHKVITLVKEQYRSLNDIYSKRDEEIKNVKASVTDKKLRDEAIAKANEKTLAETDKLHAIYLKKLGKQLNAEQIEGVKNGMTYGVLPLTYKAYQEQILTLTEPQKAQILTWLTEAREKAMDAESSEKKHAMFGKYKGRINNYLSAQGYDLKKEGIEWEKRKNAAKANKTE